MAIQRAPGLAPSRSAPSLPKAEPKTSPRTRPQSPVESQEDRSARSGYERPQDPPTRPQDTPSSPEELSTLGPGLLGEHLLYLLAVRRKRLPRQEALAEIGDLVTQIDRPELVQRALLTMTGPIADIYPLELLEYVRTRRPDLLPKVRGEPFVRNRAELENALFQVEDPISIKVPVGLKMRAFALDGGGSPGYCFAPGAPGEYVLELAAPGNWNILMRGDVAKRSIVDRLTLQVTEGPPSSD